MDDTDLGKLVLSIEAQLGDSIKVINGLKEQINDLTEQSSQGFDKMGSSWQETMKGFLSASAIIEGIKKLKDVVLDSIWAFDNEAVSIAKLHEQIGTSTKSLEDFAEAKAKTTRFSKEDTLAAASTLSAYVKNEDELKKLIPVIQDFATHQGQSLPSAANMFLRAMLSSNDSIGRYHIGIEGAAGSTERINSIIQKGTEYWGGLSDAVSKVGTGPMVIMQHQFEELQAMFASQILPQLNSLFKLVVDNKEAFSNLATGLGALVNTSLNDVVSTAKEAVVTFSDLLTPVRAIFEALKAWGELNRTQEQVKLDTEKIEKQTQYNLLIRDELEYKKQGDKLTKDTMDLYAKIGAERKALGIDLGLSSTDAIAVEKQQGAAIGKPAPRKSPEAPEAPEGTGGDLYVTQAEAALAKVKALAADMIASLDKAYKEGKETTSEYFTDLATEINREFDKEIAIKSALLDHAKAQKDVNEVTKLQGEIDVLEIQRKTELTKNAEKYNEALAQQAKLQTDIQNKLDELYAKTTKSEKGDSVSGMGPKASALKQQQDAEFKALQDELAKEQKAYDDSQGKEEATHQKLIKEKEALDKKYGDNLKKLQIASTMEQLEQGKEVTQGLESMFANLYEATGKRCIALFYLQKAASMANVAMSTAEGVMKAYGQGGWLGTVMAAVILAAGVAEEVNIASQQPPKMAGGGHLHGKKHSAGGIPIEAEDNEFVIKSQAVDYYGADRIAAINSMAISRSLLQSMVPSAHIDYPHVRFGTGGSVTGVAGAGLKATIVNYTDPTLFAKFLATTEGQNAIINVMNTNAYKVNKALGLT